jgi:glycerol kinase
VKYVLALDQGTTSSRAILFDESGDERWVAAQEFPQRFPAPGWVEHDPSEIWSSQAAVMAEVLAKSGLGPKDVAAIGITNQRETVVVWDRRTGEPLAPAIVWQDRRTAPMCERLRREGLEPLFQERTGLVLDPYFSGTKLAWLLDNVEGLRAKAERGEVAFGTVDAWLLFKLTEGEVHATDASNASRTLLFDLRKGTWDEELLRLLNVPRALLPEVRGSSEVLGHVRSPRGPIGVPIAAVLGDQQAAMAGQLCFAPGLAKNTYGTGCFLLLQTGSEAKRSTNKLLSTVAWSRGGSLSYALEGSVFVGGAVVQWLRDGLGILRNTGDVESLARSVDDSGGVVFVPAFTGLGAPQWDAHARGTILGITRGTTAAHIARAALEAIAFQVADLVTAMEQDAGVALAELRVDGGAAANDLLLQMQADFLGVPVVRPTQLESTARGAAFMAGLAVGLFPSVQSLETTWKVGGRFEPRMARDEVARRRGEWQRAVGRALAWAGDA